MNQRPKPNEKTAPARQPLEIVELSTVAAAPPPNIAEILEAVVELRAAACRFCSLVVVDEAELAQHERLHRADGKFVCCVCQAAMDGQTERYLHEQRFHRLKRPPEFAAAVGDANLKLSDHECAWRLNAGLPRLLAEADEAPAAREPKARRSKRLLEKEKKRPPRVRHMNPPNFRPVYPIAFRCTCCPQDFATARERNEHENAVHRLVRPPKEAAWEEEGSTDPKEMRHVINWPVPTVVQRPQRNPAAKRPPGIPVLPPLGLAALIVASNSDLENFRAKGLQTDGLVFG
ncbi:hypothetical protein M3Y99_00568400 [Aphelenchoides fujianensis]|nr:hypothetical protein M3Y99_00568400 [Aphelenchoides fujianensis]